MPPFPPGFPGRFPGHPGRFPIPGRRSPLPPAPGRDPPRSAPHGNPDDYQFPAPPPVCPADYRHQARSANARPIAPTEPGPPIPGRFPPPSTAGARPISTPESWPGPPIPGRFSPSPGPPIPGPLRHRCHHRRGPADCHSEPWPRSTRSRSIAATDSVAGPGRLPPPSPARSTVAGRIPPPIPPPGPGRLPPPALALAAAARPISGADPATVTRPITAAEPWPSPPAPGRFPPPIPPPFQASPPGHSSGIGTVCPHPGPPMAGRFWGMDGRVIPPPIAGRPRLRLLHRVAPPPPPPPRHRPRRPGRVAPTPSHRHPG